MNRDTMPWQMRLPATRAAIVAFVDLVLRGDEVPYLRGRVDDQMTVVEGFILMYVKGFYVADGSGSREAEVVNHLAVPRRTVRDGLGRLVGWGALVRDDSGLYYPSAVFDHWPVERFERILDRVLRLADTALVLRDAIAAARPAARN